MRTKLFPLSIAVFAIALLIFIGCNSRKSTQNAEPGVTQMLAMQDIYDWPKVQEIIAFLSDKSLGEGKKMFLEGMDEYRNKKNPAKGIELFKQSLLRYPNAKTYYELGNALMDVKQYEESIYSYRMSQNMEYEPSYNVEYNIACAYAMMGEEESAFEYLEYALESGYLNKDNLLNDEDLASIRDKTQFKSLIVEHFSDDFDMRTALFRLFAESFPARPLPYAIVFDSVTSYNYDNSVSYDFAMFLPGMMDGKYSREVSKEFLYVGRFDSLSPYLTIAYSTVEAISDTLPEIQTKLATYDTTGTQLDEIMFSCYCSPTELRDGKIEADNTITVRQIERKWKYNPIDKGYEDNEITSEKLLLTRKYRVGNDGKFIELEDTPTATAN